MPKQPQAAFESVFAFSPNRATLGGTSYLILGNGAEGASRSGESKHVGDGVVGDPSADSGGADSGGADPGGGNCLVDCPPWDGTTQEFLSRHGGVRWFVITHRDAIASLKVVREIQEIFHCQVIIQEQEAYLLPGLELTTFHRDRAIADDLDVIWTPGYSPGSSCVYLNRHGGILFSGRHLLPTPSGELRPQRQSKTFHWPRQQRSCELLRSRFTADTLQHCCPGANVGFLRGKKSIANVYPSLVQAIAPASAPQG